MNANTLEDSVDQYDAMVLDKALPDYGGINYGPIEVPTRSRSAASNGA
jgi:hypothetical protein